MKFSDALEAVKNGAKIYREGWNGKGQFVIKAGGHTVSEPRPGSDYARAGISGEFTIAPHLDLKNAQGVMQPGWVPSQGDLFADDWLITQHAFEIKPGSTIVSGKVADAVGIMQEYFPNGGRDYDCVVSLFNAILEGKIPGLGKVAKIHDYACTNCFADSGPCTGNCHVTDVNNQRSSATLVGEATYIASIQIPSSDSQQSELLYAAKLQCLSAAILQGGELENKRTEHIAEAINAGFDKIK